MIAARRATTPAAITRIRTMHKTAKTLGQYVRMWAQNAATAILAFWFSTTPQFVATAIGIRHFSLACVDAYAHALGALQWLHG